MTNRTQKAEQWPRRRSGEILFNTTNEAIIFAHIIFDNNPFIEEIEKSLYAARDQIAIMHGRDNPNLDILMQIAVKAQLFRECLEEVTRITVEE